MIGSLLVLGGARSGKSRHAELWAEARTAGPLTYIATATAGDAEMAARIAHHRARRGARWQTIEAPLALAEAISDAAGTAEAILVDCLTLWLTNVMLGGLNSDHASEALVQAVTACAVPIALVANEVGLGIVPETPLGRRFRDEAGWLNQKLAAVTNEVVFVAAGLPLVLKGGRR